MLRNWRINLKIFAASLAVGVLITLCVSFLYSEKIQAGIAESVIRFHVLANSDSDYDQQLKLLVRDAVLEKYSVELSGQSEIDASRNILQEHLNDIKELAETTLKENGCGYSVTVSLGKSFFPTKTYGDIAFPAGEYEALKIEIGGAEGKNWWCVMFPPLCFVDITQSAVTDDVKNDLKNVLTNEEYDIVVKSKTQELLPVSVKFKIVEIWQGIKRPEIYAMKE